MLTTVTTILTGLIPLVREMIRIKIRVAMIRVIMKTKAGTMGDGVGILIPRWRTKAQPISEVLAGDYFYFGKRPLIAGTIGGAWTDPLSDYLNIQNMHEHGFFQMGQTSSAGA